MTEAQLQLIEDNIGLVKLVCRTYHGRNRDEIEDVARLALVEAAAKCDPDRSYAFRKFAEAKIKQAIADYLRAEYKQQGINQKGRPIRGFIPKTTIRPIHKSGLVWDLGALRKGMWMAGVE